jgi:hypothetical protein
MDNFCYAQLNANNVCEAISQLKAEVPEYNYETKINFNPITGETTTEEVFLSRMIRIPVYSENYIGLQYTDEGKWQQAIAE